MRRIRPSVKGQDILCAETPGGPCGLVIFGASGDLAHRKLIPSLFRLFQRGLLSENFYILGCGRKDFSDTGFGKICSETIRNSSPAKVSDFIDRCYYCRGDYAADEFYSDIKTRLEGLDKKHGVQGQRIFYFSLPPFLYPTVADGIGKTALNRGPCSAKLIRAIVEKPFGRDLKTAVELNDVISKWFAEEQIYRIDHYLGKETVQNILMFRFANTIFEPVWNRNFIDHVQITIAESLGIQGRSGYYEKSGALRDMFQNHMLSMLALVTMEPPASFEPEHIRDEKVQLLKSIRPLSFEPWSEDIVRGQYTSGLINGVETKGYRDEDGVADNSMTETFVAARVFVDNWRWRDVPFYLRTGKRLPKRATEIAIMFKKVPHLMFSSAGIDELPANVLTLKIQPHEGISLQFQAKRPGAKLCIGTLAMDFNYSEVFGSEVHDAYERLLLDCMNSDQTLFTRIDDVKLAWGFVDNAFKAWGQKGSEPCFYPAGAESFSEADALLEKDGRQWRIISEM